MNIEKNQIKPVFTGNIKRINFDEIAKMGEKAFDEVKQFLPKVENIGDKDTDFYFYVSDDISLGKFKLDILCIKKFIPELEKPKKIFGNALNKIRLFLSKTHAIEDDKLLESDVNQVNLDWVLNKVYNKCMKSDVAERFNYKEHCREVKKIIAELNGK